MDNVLENRQFWEFHLEACKAYNNAVFEFPHYECMCQLEAHAISQLILQFITMQRLHRGLGNV